MKLRDMMTRGVEVVHPQDGLPEAAMKMRSLEVGSVPVCDGERLVGMLTDRDITVRAVAEGIDLKTALVDDVMTREVVYATEDQEVEEAARLMADRQIRRLPVIDRNKRLVGIVSLGDLAVDGDEDRAAGEALEQISEPARPKRMP
jgi:CBS domain-containing protein